jgi:signal transduction histidine kinase
MTQKGSSSSETRARRFRIRLPLRYRAPGESEWHTGQVENLSCSGVLFRCRYRLEQASPIEVALELPPQISGDARQSVLCGGYVARVIPPKFPFARTGLAAAFVDFRLIQASERTHARLRQAEREARRKPGADLSHSLNSALTVIVGNCELLLTSARLEENDRTSLLRILEAAERIGNLARQIDSSAI